MESLSIGQAARRSGVRVDTLRYYERIGLIDAPPRRPSGYRRYLPGVVARVRFIQRAKALGFTLRETRELLGLRVSPQSTCGEVKAAAEVKIGDIGARIADLARMKRALEAIAASCSGRGPTTDCPILEALEDGGDEPGAAP